MIFRLLYAYFGSKPWLCKYFVFFRAVPQQAFRHSPRLIGLSSEVAFVIALEVLRYQCKVESYIQTVSYHSIVKVSSPSEAAFETGPSLKWD